MSYPEIAALIDEAARDPRWGAEAADNMTERVNDLERLADGPCRLASIVSLGLLDELRRIARRPLPLAERLVLWCAVLRPVCGVPEGTMS